MKTRPYSPKESFFKKYYPIILILVGLFLVLFPFDIIIADALGENAIFLIGLFAVPAVGFVFYYRKRKEYSANIRKIAKISAIILPLIFVGAVIVGVALGVSIVFFPPSYENTMDIDTDLFEKKVLDWVNTNRYKNNVGGVNLDDALNRLAEIRMGELIQSSPEELESVGNIDANEIAKREGIKCMIDGKPANIDDYIMIIPHSKYTDIEKLTNFVLTFMTNDEEPREIVFVSNATKTGIKSFMTEDNLIVIQNFC